MVNNINVIDLIEKYYEGTDDDSTVVFYDGAQVTDIDKENKEIYYDDSETLSFDEIDIDFIKVFDVDKLEIEDDITLYIKDVKNAKKSLEKYNNPNTKKITIFKQNGVFITAPELLDELLSIEFIVDYFDTLELFELKLIKI